MIRYNNNVRLSCEKPPTRNKRIKCVRAAIICVVVGILLLYVVFDFANRLFDIAYPILNTYLKKILEWPFANKLAYYTIFAIIWGILSFFVFRGICNLLAPKVAVRDKSYILRLFSGERKYGSPAPTRVELARDICDKEKVPRQVQDMVANLIDENIANIKKFFEKSNSRNILNIDAKWGAGKTTSLLIAIDELTDRNNENRYVYESAFKYGGNTNEFVNDILSALGDTMLELGIEAASIINSIICNLDSSPQKTLAGFVKKYRKMSVPSAELIFDLNNQYKKSNKHNLIYIIVDDIDRLQGDDMINILSLLSILRKLNFVRVIVPADLKIICATLENAKVVDATRFIEKYLPSKLSVKLRSGYDMAESVLLNKMLHAQDNRNHKNDGARPALAAIFIGMLAKKMVDETRNYRTIRYRWLTSDMRLHIPSDKETNDAVSQLLYAPTTMRTITSDYGGRYTWDAEHNNIQRFQDIIYAMKRKYGHDMPIRISEAFSDEEYSDIIDPWIFNFMEQRWDIFGFTIRDALDVLESIEYDNLPKNPAEQFVHVFNQLFPDDQMKTIK